MAGATRARRSTWLDCAGLARRAEVERLSPWLALEADHSSIQKETGGNVILLCVGVGLLLFGVAVVLIAVAEEAQADLTEQWANDQWKDSHDDL